MEQANDIAMKNTGSIETERFGKIELESNKVFRFPHGIPGFEHLKEFVLVEVPESRPLYWLQATEDTHICLPVVIPFDFMEDYFIEINDHELHDVKIEDKNDVLLLNVVVIPEDISKMTANMAAPIVINMKLCIGKQIIIDAKELPIRFPIYEMIMRKLKGGQEDAGTVKEEG